MTRPITLSFGSDSGETAVSNIFIDEYMTEANGAYVKVYIYLLRCLGDSSMSISVASISEKLDETEKDIIKALRYWEKQKLLHITWDAEGQINSITLNPLNTETHKPARIISLSVSEPEAAELPVAEQPVEEAAMQITKPSYSARQIAKFKQHDDFNELIDYIEEHLGCTMKPSDLQTPAFLYEQLGMSADLIRFLYDYCLYSGKTAPAYIEKVAISWHEKGVDSIDRARVQVFSRSKECSAIKSAFGITRSFGSIEYEFIDRWRFTYNMSVDMIVEACSRTLLNLGRPDFKYTDSTLKHWHEHGITDAEGIAADDSSHAERVRKTKASGSQMRNQTSSNKFNQFSQRSYEASDYDDLESRKIGKL